MITVTVTYTFDTQAEAQGLIDRLDKTGASYEVDDDTDDDPVYDYAIGTIREVYPDLDEDELDAMYLEISKEFGHDYKDLF